jgi:hypothetical protein
MSQAESPARGVTPRLGFFSRSNDGKAHRLDVVSAFVVINDRRVRGRRERSRNAVEIHGLLTAWLR